jgi:D-aspartate ligase
LCAMAESMRYPLIAKPAYPFNWSPALARVFRGRKALQLDHPAQVVALADRLDAWAPGILLQACVVGPDDAHHDVHAYVDRAGQARAVFTGRKWRLFPPHAGSGCHVESVSDPALEAATLAMLKQLGFRGIANVNYKRDAADGRHYLLEINARLSQWSIFTTRCGVNLAWLAYCDALGLDPGPLPDRRIGRHFVDAWLDLRAARQYRREAGWRWWPYLASLLRPGTVYQVFTLSDLRPWWRLLRQHVHDMGRPRVSGAGRASSHELGSVKAKAAGVSRRDADAASTSRP